jgi:hypothetical protein
MKLRKYISICKFCGKPIFFDALFEIENLERKHCKIKGHLPYEKTIFYKDPITHTYLHVPYIEYVMWVKTAKRMGITLEMLYREMTCKRNAASPLVL